VSVIIISDTEYGGLTIINPSIIGMLESGVAIRCDMVFIPNEGLFNGPVEEIQNGNGEPTYIQHGFRLTIRNNLVVKSTSQGFYYETRHPIEIAQALKCEDWYWQFGSLNFDDNYKCVGWTEIDGWFNVSDGNR
jgi:hypothetical protein